MKGNYKVLCTVVFIFAALGVGALAYFPISWDTPSSRIERQPRIITPQSLDFGDDEIINLAELLGWNETITAWVPLEEGEMIVSVLNGNFGGSLADEQFVAYRNLLEPESPIYLAFIGYDDVIKGYTRLWSAPTAATRPGTINLYTQDLLGDHGVCALLSGMNAAGEHTLTIFRLNTDYRAVPAGQRGNQAGNGLLSKIAELKIDGSITVREVTRTQAYQMGTSQGQSFTISAHSRDFESANIMDQIEIIYGYNAESGLFEQRSRTRIPGAQIEQRLLREVLGNSRAFEEFLTGLWFYVSPQGTIDRNQYIYFNSPSREIIFYEEGTQQVFTWQNSAATRLGLYISSENISITTLRRTMDIELESLDSIRIRTVEGIRLNIRGINASWDGSYRKAGQPEKSGPSNPGPISAHIDALYDSSIGKIRFSPNGVYELNAWGNSRQGQYAFFSMNDQELLEFRSEGISGPLREIYLVEGEREGDRAVRKTLTLSRVRIGARGIEKLNERAISLALSE